MSSQLVKCTKCKRVSFAMARADVEAQIASFNAYYEGQRKRKRSAAH